jgi:ribosomal protein S18 acetylase RimI-like enzyme
MSLMIQPYQPDDLDPVLRVLAEAMPHDPIPAGRFTQQVLLDANFLAEGALVARVEGQVAGFCLAIARQVPLENAPPDGDRGYVTLIGVSPSHQRRGIGSRLLAQAEDFLSAQSRTVVAVSPYAPGYFLPGVDVETYAGGLQFFLEHGYREVYRPVAMEAPLWGGAWPDWVARKRERLAEEGVHCEAYHPELTLPLLEFTRRGFPGDWVRVVREAMGRLAGGESDPQLTIAHEQGRVLGFAHTRGERFGPIGVAAAERGRGLGHVLMFTALDGMRAQGFRTAWFLWSDDETARRLYHSAGFRERRRFALLRKELTA